MFRPAGIEQTGEDKLTIPVADTTCPANRQPSHPEISLDSDKIADRRL